MTCSTIIRLNCKWVLHGILKISYHTDSLYKKFLLVFQDKIRTDNFSNLFVINQLEFNRYRSTLFLDPILYSLQPRVLILNFQNSEEPRNVVGNFVSNWIKMGYRVVEEVRIISIEPSQLHEIEALKELVNLKKVSIINLNWRVPFGVLLRNLPREITSLSLETEKDGKYPFFRCQFCSLGSIGTFKHLVVIDLPVHPMGLKMISHYIDTLPSLEALRLKSLSEYECQYQENNPFGNMPLKCIFPNVQEFALEGTLPTAKIFPLVGNEIRFLSLLLRGEEQRKVTSLLVHLGTNKFPMIQNLKVQRGNLAKLTSVFGGIQGVVIETSLLERSYNGPRRWNYQRRWRF